MCYTNILYMKLNKYSCWHCGACCKVGAMSAGVQKQVAKYGVVPRDNGYCVYYDLEGMRCSIYNDRPKVCRSKWWEPGFLKQAACEYLDKKINNN